MSSDRTHPLKKHNAQLEAEVRALRKWDQMQRQRFAQKYGRKFLTLIVQGATIASKASQIKILAAQIL